MDLNKKMRLQLFILLFILDRNCHDVAACVVIICQFINLFVIVQNHKFIFRKGTKLYQTFSTQFGMYLTITIVYCSQSYIKTSTLPRVDAWTSFICCTALYWASPYLFSGYFKHYNAYLKWALISNFLHAITGKWIYSLIMPFWLLSDKPSFKEKSTSDLCEALCSRMCCTKSIIIPCFVIRCYNHVIGLTPNFPWEALAVRFRRQASPDSDADIALNQEDDNIIDHAPRRPNEEVNPDDAIDLSSVTNPGSEELAPPLALSDEGLYAMAQGTADNLYSPDSGISGATGHTSLMHTGSAISLSHQDSTRHAGLGNTVNDEMEDSFNSFTRDGQDLALADEDYSAVAQGGNTQIYTDSGMSISHPPNNVQLGSDHESGAHSIIYESITLVKEVFTPGEPEDESANSSVETYTNFHSRESESDDEHPN